MLDPNVPSELPTSTPTSSSSTRPRAHRNVDRPCHTLASMDPLRARRRLSSLSIVSSDLNRTHKSYAYASDYTAKNTDKQKHKHQTQSSDANISMT